MGLLFMYEFAYLQSLAVYFDLVQQQKKPLYKIQKAI